VATLAVVADGVGNGATRPKVQLRVG